MHVFLLLLVLALVENKLPLQLIRGSSCEKLSFCYAVHLTVLGSPADTPRWVILDPLGTAKDTLAMQPDLVPIIVSV